jgi:hypothetical protein
MAPADTAQATPKSANPKAVALARADDEKATH